MEIAEYENIFKNEESHFFYVATDELVMALAENVVPKKKIEILDAGCGTGGLALKLKSLGRVKGFDWSENAVAFCRKRKIQAVKGDIKKIPYANNKFNLVTCIDVIVHDSIKNKLKPFQEINRVLKPGGYLIMRVAANSWLSMAHDKFVHSSKRFDKHEVLELAQKAGLSVKKISYVHSPLLPLMIVKYWIEKIFKTQPKSSVGQLPGWLNTIILKILRIENNWLVSNNLPFGVGLILVAKKPSDR